jgi:hypothetical protein
VVVLCNTPEQVTLFSKHGMNCILCNQNAFVDEAVFAPDLGEVRSFDAIYNGGLAPFKRHQLCTRLESLALIYSAYHGTMADPAHYSSSVPAMLPQAFFVNHSVGGGQHVNLSGAQCAQWYNRARVGLCLSAREGAMYASIEYLLCGLPVVSTPSRGGRDHFFDEDIALIVEPTPQAVAEGVREMAARNLAPDFVRNRTLEKIGIERRRFLALLRSIFVSLGYEYPGDTIWKSIFVDKMIGSVRGSQLPDLVFRGA